MTANDQIRQNLRELMDWRQMTQADLAEALGVSQPWVSKRLSGITPFQIEDLDAIGKVFGLTPAELLQPGYGQWDRRLGSERRSGAERRRSKRHGVTKPLSGDGPPPLAVDGPAEEYD